MDPDSPEPPVDPTPVLGGLNPADLLRQGAAGDTLFEKELPFVPPSLEEMAAIFPRFEILNLIGTGGMGAVYQVRQRDLERFAALKILPPAIGAQPGFSERFAREAKALARLNHPGIVTLYEFGRSEGEGEGLYYFLMEYVDGANLRQVMERERLSTREAMAIVPQICDALRYAHDHGVVHRDIKPENLLLDRRGQVKIADFGIARLVGQTAAEDASSSSVSIFLTGSEGVIGTPAYMAPEQSGDPAAVDHRADIYAVGVVFYQMLTGELPGTPLHAPSRKISLDVRLDEVVLRALENNPARRYSSADDLKTRVETIAATPQYEPVPLSVPSTRLSLLAVSGAIWAGLFLFSLASAGLSWSAALQHAREPAVSLAGHPLQSRIGFIIGLFGLVGMLAPIGTTILGWMAVSRIRHSKGQIRGLRLAMFDGVLFPMLFVNLAFIAVGLFFTVNSTLFSPTWPVLIVPAAALVEANVFFVRSLWRRLTGRDPLTSKRRLLMWVAIQALIVMALLVFAAIGPSSHASPKNFAGTWEAPKKLSRKPMDALSKARINLELARPQYNSGEIDDIAMEYAESRVAILEAEATGDAVLIAQTKLACARRRLAVLIHISKQSNPAASAPDLFSREIITAEEDLNKALTAAGLPLDQPFFGPVIERTLYPFETNPRRCFFDLDTGSFTTVPTAVTPYLNVEGNKSAEGKAIYESWVQGMSCDLWLAGNRPPLKNGMRLGFVPYSWFYGGERIVVPKGSFETATPANVREWSRKQVRSGPNEPASSGVNTGTSVFRTRSGAIGIMEGISNADWDKGHVIRYRLIQPPPSPR